MKDIYISDLSAFDEGRIFDGYFLVLARQLATTKTNKSYMKLILGDKSGSVDAVAWELSDPRLSREVERGEMHPIRVFNIPA